MKTPAQLLADKAVARNMANRIPAMPTPVQPVQTAQPVQQPVQQNTLGPNIVKNPITLYSQGGNPIPGSNMVTGQTQQKPIATSTQPVVSLGEVQPKQQQGMEYNASIYDPYKSYSKSDMENWLDLASVKVGQKQQLTEQDQLIGRFMQRRLQELSAPGQLEDPTQKLVEEQRVAQEEARIRLQGQDKQMYDAEQQRIDAYYEKRKAETLQSAQRRQDKVQSATSFSGFGRSTFNADQQAQIQQEAEAAISLDQQEMQLAMDRYRRAQEGATAEELSSYDDRITQLQGQSSQFKIAQYEAINEYNQQHASNISSAIDNLFALSSQNQPETPLTDDEVAQAQSYAQLIIGADGKVDTKLLETIPPRLINSAIMQGAQIKGAIKPEADGFGFQNMGDGVIARTNPNTGEVEYSRSGFSKNKAPQTVKTDSGTYQYNEASGLYDISVGSTTQDSGAQSTVLDTIKKWEGFREKAYQDSIGKRTVGYGFTTLNGRPVQPGDSITREEADGYLLQEIDRHSSWKTLVTAPLSPSQEAALASFEFNLGPGIWKKNAMPIIDAVNKGDFNSAASLIQKYNQAGGNVVKGLVNRRNEEAQLIKNTQQPTQPAQETTTYNRNFVEDYKKANLGKLTGIDKTQLAKEFGSIENFNIQSNLYGKEMANKGVGKLSDFRKDLQFLKDNYSLANLASVKTGVGGYAAIYENVKNKKSFQELLDLKANGATFGALTETEFENIGKSTEVGKLTVTAGKNTWITAIDRLIRDIDSIERDIATDNPYYTGSIMGQPKQTTQPTQQPPVQQPPAQTTTGQPQQDEQVERFNSL